MSAWTSGPAVVYGMPSADYHAVHALGASGLRKLARSPRHYFAATLDPDRPPSDPTPAMRAGTLAHCAILEPDMLAALCEALEFAEDQEDVIDGNYGQPLANDAMRLAQTLRAAIAKATGEAA